MVIKALDPDPDPVEMNADPQPWEQGHSKYLSLAQLLTGTEARDLYSKGAEILTASLQAQPFLNSTQLIVSTLSTAVLRIRESQAGTPVLYPWYSTGTQKYFFV